ncbi:MerR family transcriptional regulator [Nocardia sp. NPDC127526]|uniref:MerR family transcriptional regulator n=1 Tax=Nocardia sp. NPDC127526 TaxID=3345393 RepID=UPI00362ECC51
MASGFRVPEQSVAGEYADDGLTVGRTAGLVGLSVRTLHHWDVIGLVRPSDRTSAGYRLYAPADIARIHRVLVYRELGFPLAQIAQLLDDPATDAREHLRRQRTELVDRIARLESMVGAVDRMLEASAKGMQLTPEQQVEIFGSDWQPEWIEEAEQRWGDSAQWAQWADRTADWTPADWTRITAETNELNADLATAKRDGVSPGSAEANALAERHRALMSRYFDCTRSMQSCMARMFIEEPGYADYYDAFEPGLCAWFRDIIYANARTHGIDPDSARWE